VIICNPSVIGLVFAIFVHKISLILSFKTKEAHQMVGLFFCNKSITHVFEVISTKNYLSSMFQKELKPDEPATSMSNDATFGVVEVERIRHGNNSGLEVLVVYEA
jgi:hypothetical protein